MYSLLRPGLFALDAERSHDLTLTGLARAAPLARRFYGARVPDAPASLMGLDLPNPVGLAAGLDKNGARLDGLAALGFGFIEIGTVTPRAQPGNPRPRLFRLPEQRALINRMGFNNDGVDTLVANVRAARFSGVLGVNIGKNHDTPAESAVDDYLHCLKAVHEVASYITLNVSSPNTKGLRAMQERDPLDRLFEAVIAERDRLGRANGRQVPLAIKIAPDLDDDGLQVIADRVLAHGMDGVIATNTTTDRAGLTPRWQDKAGGLSGAPLRRRATGVVQALCQHLGEAVPVIGVGGVASGHDATEKMKAGAQAIQLYSGLIYRGPALVRECVEAAARWQARRRIMAQAAVVRSDRARAAAGAKKPGQ